MRSKSIGLGFTFLAAAAIWVFAGSSTQAFHSGGVAECGGCHSMHSPNPAGSFLLLGADTSSTCLNCHQNAADTGPSSYHVSTAPNGLAAEQAPKQRTPGGDFGWLKKTYTFTGRDGSIVTELGETHGHNIVATDYAYSAATDPQAPGGTFKSELGCTSCHDPHGLLRRNAANVYVRGGVVGEAAGAIIGSGSYATSKTPGLNEAVGVYRLLRGGGDVKDNVTFSAIGIAVAPVKYNQSEATNQVRVAYGTSGTNTWGNWCASCHSDMHSSGNYVHPVDESLGSKIANIYGAYVKSGDLMGSHGTSFSSLVPFVQNTSDFAALAANAVSNNTKLQGPDADDKVTCLSCHRAHASGFEYGLRWNIEYEFMTMAGLYTSGTNAYLGRGRVEGEMIAAYYDRPASSFATYQRVLCNKCHAKD